MDLLGFVRRYGPISVFGSAFNLVVCTILVVVFATSSAASFMWVPALGLDLVFAGVFVVSLITRRRWVAEVTREDPVDEVAESSGPWRELPPLGVPRDDTMTRWHASNAILAFLTDDIGASDARAWATTVLEEGIPFEKADAELLREFLSAWSDPEGLITRHSAYLWQTRFADR